MIWPLVAMLAMSAAKSAEDERKNSSDKKVNAEIERYSPWTHMQPGAVTKADTAGTMAGGLASGLAMEQSMGKDDTAPTKGAASAAESNASTTKGASFAGTGVTPAQANAAPGSAMADYSKPGAAGYSPYQLDGAAPPQQVVVGDPSTYPTGYDPFSGSSAGANKMAGGKGWYGVAPKKS